MRESGIELSFNKKIVCLDYFEPHFCSAAHFNFSNSSNFEQQEFFN